MNNLLILLGLCIWVVASGGMDFDEGCGLLSLSSRGWKGKCL